MFDASQFRSQLSCYSPIRSLLIFAELYAPNVTDMRTHRSSPVGLVLLLFVVADISRFDPSRLGVATADEIGASSVAKHSADAATRPPWIVASSSPPLSPVAATTSTSSNWRRSGPSSTTHGSPRRGSRNRVATIDDNEAAVRDIWMIGLFPLKGSWAGGLGQRPAVEMGLEDVNADPSILRGYRLRMTVDDTSV